jgi:multidrug resistance protein, MATE family
MDESPSRNPAGSADHEPRPREVCPAPGAFSGIAGGYAEVLRVSVPLILSTASLTVMLFVDRLFLSWHSQSSVAASTPGGITSFTICSLFFGTAQYVNTLVAQYHGRGNKPACARAVWQGVFLAVLSVPLILCAIPLGQSLLCWSGHAPEVLALEQDFFFVLMIGGIALPFGGAFSSFFSGRGKTAAVMWGNLMGNAANVMLDYVLIFGHFGFPELGIRGAGIATAASGVIPVIYWAWLFLSARYQDTYHTRRECVWDRHLFLMLLRYGAPAGVQLFLDVASFTMFVLIVGRVGEQALATTNIVFAVNMLSYLPMVGMSIAASTLVGEYIGRGQPDAAERSAYSALKLSLGYALFFSVLYFAIPGVFMDLFSPSSHPESDFSEIAHTGAILLRFVAVYSVFDAVFVVMSGALKGAGDTRFAMIVQTLLAWGLLVGPVYIAVTWLRWGLLGPWYILLGYVMSVGIVFLLRFRSGYWKTINLAAQ